MRMWSENFDSFDIPIDVAKQAKTESFRGGIVISD